MRQGGHGSSDSLLYDAEGNETMSYQVGALGQQDPAVDRASYYGADGRLRSADARTIATPSQKNATISTRVIENYRYDALGRRVLKEAILWCPTNTPIWITCHRSTLRRMVWDGSLPLDEIQVQDTSVVAIAEADTGVVKLGVQCSGTCADNNPYFGRVLYTHGLTTDQPLAVTRVDYADSTGIVNGIPGTPLPYFLHAPLTMVPIWNAYGRWDMVVDYECATFAGRSRCVRSQVQAGLNPYDNLRVNNLSFLGSLLEDQRDETGTRYRRARTYDPVTGRFTQEDPIGLAGGVNAYGFVAGDPVNYSDPFGLCPDGDWQCAIEKALAEISAGLPGSLGGGEVAGAIGLLCGPLAEVCSPVGALAGGIVGGVGAAAAAGKLVDLKYGDNALQQARAGKGRGGNQKPNADVRRIAKESDLNAAGRRELHDRITGQDLTTDEIRSEAEDVAKQDKFRNTPPPTAP